MKGFINLYKPKGMSSAQAVASVKRQLNLNNEKVGHAGTLDPLASGILPICVGRATRLFDYMLSKEKTYIAEFTFGYETNTIDAEGEVIHTSTKIPTKEEIEKILPSFLGEIEQIPPQFSAKSIDGKRAYENARKGKIMQLKPCKVIVKDFVVLEQKSRTTFTFRITCGSGTYIRSLARDVGHKLSTYATMTNLQRVKSGVFSLDNCVQLIDVSRDSILPCEVVLDKLEKIDLSEQHEKLLLQGKSYHENYNDGIFRAYVDKELIGLLEIKNSLPKMKVWLK